MMMQTENPTPEMETSASPEDGAGVAGAGADMEFMHVPIDQIATGPQVRREIDPDSESIHALADSITQKGIVQPLTVSRSGDGYFLVVGERRLLAARLAGLSSVPVCVIPTIQRREDALWLQLIENFQREDLNPMDMAEGLFALFQARHGAVAIDDIINSFILYERSPERLANDFVDTVSTIVKITGKSTRSVQRVFEFLRLPGELQEALRTGQISVSQGYIFSDYLTNPDLLDIFHNLLVAPVTNEKLKQQLDAFARRAKGGRLRTYRPFLGISASIKAADATLSDQTKPVTKDDLTTLLDELRALAVKVETRLQALPPEEETPTASSDGQSAG
jgi:ParB family chromosome partitioning protein